MFLLHVNVTAREMVVYIGAEILSDAPFYGSEWLYVDILSSSTNLDELAEKNWHIYSSLII